LNRFDQSTFAVRYALPEADGSVGCGILAALLTRNGSSVPETEIGFMRCMLCNLNGFRRDS
jgi:hypothetical protein